MADITTLIKLPSQSPSKHQRIIELESGIIRDTFNGELVSFVHYKDKTGEDKVQQMNEAFLEILVNVIGNKEL